MHKLHTCLARRRLERSLAEQLDFVISAGGWNCLKQNSTVYGQAGHHGPNVIHTYLPVVISPTFNSRVKSLSFVQLPMYKQCTQKHNRLSASFIPRRVIRTKGSWYIYQRTVLHV